VKSTNDDPIRQFTLLVLFQAQDDHATELVIASSDTNGAAIKYKVGDTWCDMSPPPSHILPDVVDELGKLATFTGGGFPKAGTIDMPFSGIRLRWKIWMASPDAACILNPIQD
jgi:hypothetical protein